MIDPLAEWSIPRLGIYRRVPSGIIRLAYALAALALVSGLLTGNLARIGQGALLLAVVLVGTNAGGLRDRIPSLNGASRRWSPNEQGGIVLVGLLAGVVLIADLFGTWLLGVVGLVGIALVSDVGGLRSRLPLLGSPDWHTAALGWGGLWVVGLVVVSLVASGSCRQQPTTGATSAASNAPLQPASVVRVVDGDTIEVRIGGIEDRVRIIGLNTPESGPPRGVQCYGKEASNQARRLLGGATIRLETDPSQAARDQYGRLLAHVWLPDGRLFAWSMIREGFAEERTYAAAYRYRDDYLAAQESARKERLGLWGACMVR